MRVIVRNMTGEEDIFDNIEPTDVVQKVKLEIQKKKRILIARQRLMFGDNELKNQETLSSYGVPDGARLQIIMRAAQSDGTIAGGFGPGHASDEFCYPYAIRIHSDGSMIVADWGNHRIVQWKNNENQGRVVAGGQGQGSALNQLSCPTDVLIDSNSNCVIICDRGNKRIVRWSLDEGTTEGKKMISGIDCWGIALDDQRNLYVSDTHNHQVKLYKIGEENVPVVAGIKGRGVGLDQLHFPTYLFVDAHKNLYVADSYNYRVMKWQPDAQKGKIVAWGYSRGLFVDNDENVYIADYGNHRLVCWPKDAKEGTVILDQETNGNEIDGIYSPWGISHDQQGHIYVIDHSNHRIHRRVIAT